MPGHYTPTRTELASGLYIVATPIGNLGDITLRALNILASVDLIACEDTRISKRLLHHFGLHTLLEAYHEHNAAKMRPKLLEKLKKGGRIALISDAGTPLISDPGYKLVKEAIQEGIAIIPIPGPSSVTAALSMAGLPTDKFLFLGFLPSNNSDVEHLLTHCAEIPASLVLFSTPGKLQAHLTHCLNRLGDREIAVCRELTKIYEEAWRGTISSLLKALGKTFEPRGELVLVIAPASGDKEIDLKMLDAALVKHLAEMPLKTAVQTVATLYGLPKNKVYQRALTLQK